MQAAVPEAILPPSILQEYIIVGRRQASEKEVNPPVYRMRIFATNHVTATSRFWKYMKMLKKIKPAHGEILGMWRVSDASLVAKNYAIWIRFVSRKGVHNIYKEFRDVSAARAVQQAYQTTANNHRVKRTDVHIIDIKMIKDEEAKRDAIKQIIQPGLKFPLPHRVIASLVCRGQERYSYVKPKTFFH